MACSRRPRQAPSPTKRKRALGTAGDDAGGGGDEIVVTFEGEEPGDFADDEMLGAETEALAEVRVGRAFEERGEVEAAEDAGVLVGVADAGGEVLLGHGIRDRDEMGGGAGGDVRRGGRRRWRGRFGRGRRRGRGWCGRRWGRGRGGRRGVRGNRLYRYGCGRCRASGAQEVGEGAPGLEVEPRVDGANEGGTRVNGIGRARAGFEGTFGAGGGAGDQFDIEMVPVRRPRTVARVFSWAPPTMRRVMMWMTRIRRAGGPRTWDGGISFSCLELAEAIGDLRASSVSAGRVGGRGLVVLDGVGVVGPGGRRFRRGRRGSGVRWACVRARRGKRLWRRRVGRFGGGRWRG
jgi:hypothetical protein